jgi:hypothetical protein
MNDADVPGESPLPAPSVQHEHRKSLLSQAIKLREAAAYREACTAFALLTGEFPEDAEIWSQERMRCSVSEAPTESLAAQKMPCVFCKPQSISTQPTTRFACFTQWRSSTLEPGPRLSNRFDATR